MSAARSPMATRDLILVLLATATLVLTHWPKAEPQRVVVRHVPEAGEKRFRLAADDPRLAWIQRHLPRRKSFSADGKLAAARWQQETAAFYATTIAERWSLGEATPPEQSGRVSALGQTSKSPPSNDIQPVNYILPGQQQREQAESQNRAQWLTQRDYWLRVEQQTASATTEAQRTLDLARQSADPPSLRIGAEVQPPPGTIAWLIALVSGMLMATLWWAWEKLCPALSLSTDLCLSTDGEATPAVVSGCQEVPENEPRRIELCLPAAWVKLRQPALVQFRGMLLWLLTLAAMISAFPSV